MVLRNFKWTSAQDSDRETLSPDVILNQSSALTQNKQCKVPKDQIKTLIVLKVKQLGHVVNRMQHLRVSRIRTEYPPHPYGAGILLDTQSQEMIPHVSTNYNYPHTPYKAHIRNSTYLTGPSKPCSGRPRTEATDERNTLGQR
jgi:hypothetical protein